MKMGEFEVVIGMDWLSQYHARVNCYHKTIKLTSPSGKQITIHGETNCNPIVCSMLEAKKLVQHGCKAYITYVTDTRGKSRAFKTCR